ncbi:hypothetical protein CCYA_CCYA01G0340 [Cyanidiococcus yangmingshanensis]|nr:hypothetical protein CCYA_CCYA01G0340 [Cyanidiococcus yangmingshanensis]
MQVVGAHTERRIIVPGKFDALHIGHRELVRRAVAYGKPLILSFSGMAQVLGKKPLLPIVARSHMDLVIRSWCTAWQYDSVVSAAARPGQEAVLNTADFEVLVIPFAEIRHLSPEDFIVQYLYKELGARGIVCGWDWRFGYRAAGDVTLLESLSERLETMSPDGWVFETVPPVLQDGEKVSSSRVRRYLASGRVREAARMLDRFHCTTARCLAIRNPDESLDLTVECWENQPPASMRFYECRVELQPMNFERNGVPNPPRIRFDAYVWIGDTDQRSVESAHRSETFEYHPSRLRIWPVDRSDMHSQGIAVRVNGEMNTASIALDRAMNESHSFEVVLEFRSLVTRPPKTGPSQRLSTARLVLE